ncbi:MAG: SDR family NAD(P)-dependent oxidoreductase [Nitrososphaeraceae archaeon]
MKELKFSSKVVVITGSGTGIGQAIAKKFAENGSSIVIMGRRKEPLEKTSIILSDIIKKVGSSGVVRVFPGVDVSDEEGINSMFKKLKEEFGKVDILINNAGVSGPVKTFTKASFEDFKSCVSIHLTGTFWTSIKAIELMSKDSKIITIATFFTEENRYEQRPYRFRTPYTAAQGAKNRLAEALAWELSENEIRSISTNPGPVHSDRIYKTVYPKAAAEFLRIGGYPGLGSVEIESASTIGLELLGESSDIYNNGISKIAKMISDVRKENNSDSEDIKSIVDGMLTKIQEIAEKVQKNTSKMIVDGEFLAQEDVAEMVLNLSDDKISKLINGRIIPNDRVFYPVKPIVGTLVGDGYIDNLRDKVIVITTTSSNPRDIKRITSTASKLNSNGAKQVIILFSNSSDSEYYKDFHSHNIELTNEEKVQQIFNTAKTKFGNIDVFIHVTGDYDYNKHLSTLSRNDWDKLVEQFIYVPALITKHAVISMSPTNAVFEPTKFKESNGKVIILGPDAPVGKKIGGLVRARSDVFRGALRPYTATVNQELSDVLKSNIKLHLVLPGNTNGQESTLDNVQNSLLNLSAGSALNKNESIFYIDET